jgi:hypothetical protein
MLRSSVTLGTCAVLLSAVPLAGQTGHEELITVKDVEDVTGLEGIKLVVRSSQMGAGGDLNFALADGALLLTVGIQDAAMYDEWKGEEGFFHADVPDLGDEAFEGPAFGEQRYVLIFRKGATAIALSSFFNMQAGGAPYLSQDQLREIAWVAISRL